MKSRRGAGAGSWHSAPGLAVAVAALSAGGCAPGPTRTIAAGESMLAVRAPRSADGDAPSVLVDHVVGSGSWHCSAARAPLRYELMFADGLPRQVRAVGVVASNLGPDGLGGVEVRVQNGHGVAAQGQTFHARARPRNEQLVVFELPVPVRGDHVLFALRRRSAYSTARCLGEILVFGAASPLPEGALRVPLLPGAVEERARTEGAAGVAGAGEDAGAATDAASAADAADAANAAERGDAAVEASDAGAERSESGAGADAGAADAEAAVRPRDH